jgi:hypothetical protein
MCPICVTSSAHGSRSRFVLLADHMVTAHDDESMGGEDPIPSSSTTQTRRGENEEVIKIRGRRKILIENNSF